MATTLLLKQMTKAENLRAMESLWADLSADANALEMPSWHAAELATTVAGIRAGTVAVVDWEQAKKSIQRRTK